MLDTPKGSRRRGPLAEAGRQLFSPLEKAALTPPPNLQGTLGARPMKKGRGMPTRFFHKPVGVWLIGGILLLGVFGSFYAYYGRVGTQKDMALSLSIEPPDYTHRPSLVLWGAEKSRLGGFLDVPGGSVISARYDGAHPPAIVLDGAVQNFEATAAQTYTLSVPLPNTARVVSLKIGQEWPWRASWQIKTTADDPPRIDMTAPPEIMKQKTVRLRYEAADDYGLRSIAVRLRPMDGGKAEDLVIARPGLLKVKRVSYEDLTGMKLSGGRVQLSLVATDDKGQQAETKPMLVTLPSREFRHPMARALIEERQKLLAADADEQTRNEAIGVMAGMARQGQGYGNDPAVLMTLRAGAVRLILDPSPAAAQQVADLMWQTALRIETGPLGQAQASLREVERDLFDALDRGASADDLMRFVARLQNGLVVLLNELLSARAPDPPPVSDRAFVLQSEKDYLTREDLQNMLLSVRTAVLNNETDKARAALESLENTLESLQPASPDLSQAQRQLLQQVAVLRDLIQGQRRLLDQMQAFLRSPLRGKASMALRQKWADFQGQLVNRARDLGVLDPAAGRALSLALVQMKGAQGDVLSGSFGPAGEKQKEALQALDAAAQSTLRAARATQAAHPEAESEAP